MSTSQPNQPSANVRIILSLTGQSSQIWVVPVIPETTLGQILTIIGVDPERFNPSAPHPYVFVNEGETEMPWLANNMLDYNNWYVEHGFIPSLYIKDRRYVITDHSWQSS